MRTLRTGVTLAVVALMVAAAVAVALPAQATDTEETECYTTEYRVIKEVKRSGEWQPAGGSIAFDSGWVDTPPDITDRPGGPWTIGEKQRIGGEWFRYAETTRRAYYECPLDSTTTTTEATTTTTEPEGVVTFDATCDLLTVTNESDETVLAGHSEAEADIHEVAPGQTLAIPGRPGVDWYVYSQTTGFLGTGTFPECTPDTSTTVSETTTTVDPEDNDDPVTEDTTPTPLPTIVSETTTTDATDDVEAAVLPFTGPTDGPWLPLAAGLLVAGLATLGYARRAL